jgi:hypothetical protein
MLAAIHHNYILTSPPPPRNLPLALRAINYLSGLPFPPVSAEPLPQSMSFSPSALSSFFPLSLSPYCQPMGPSMPYGTRKEAEQATYGSCLGSTHKNVNQVLAVSSDVCYAGSSIGLLGLRRRYVYFSFATFPSVCQGVTRSGST